MKILKCTCGKKPLKYSDKKNNSTHLYCPECHKKGRDSPLDCNESVSIDIWNAFIEEENASNASINYIFSKGKLVVDFRELSDRTIPFEIEDPLVYTGIRFYYKDATDRFEYIDDSLIPETYKELKQFLTIYRNNLNKTSKEKGTVMIIFKNYFLKHEETLITIFILFLLDEYIFNGKFKDKTTDLMDCLITSVKNKIVKKEENTIE